MCGMTPAWYAGVDGCRDGWFAILLRFSGDHIAETRSRLCSNFLEVVELPEQPVRCVVDIPIGLLAQAERGGRGCDRAARRLLGPRRSSVFPPPARRALQLYPDFRQAVAANQMGITLQSWNIFAKMKEVDGDMTPALQERMVEGHPELAFLSLADHPMKFNKKRSAGRAERLKAIEDRFTAGGVDLRALRRLYSRDAVATDDILDAWVLAVTAWRIDQGGARRLPEGEVPVDARGLRMEIWF